MAAETLTVTATLVATDVSGNRDAPAPFISSYTSQTRISKLEYTVPFGSTPVDLYDPFTWTGYPFTAFKAAFIAIQDAPQVTQGINTQSCEIEILPSFNTTAKAGLIFTLPAGDWMKIPSNASYNNPTNATDQWTGSAAAVFNRIRARNTGTAVNVKLTMWLVDSTTP